MKMIIKIILSLIFLGAVFGIIATRKTPEVPETGFHYSLNGSRDFFEDAYKNVGREKPDSSIAGITVNHHLIAPNLIAQEFALVQTDKPITVVLISPNHFMRGEGGAISSRSDWQTPYGILETDKDLVEKLKQTGVVNIDEAPFEQEHGINGLVGFIKKSLPNTQFVPLIIKDNFSDENTDRLAEKLNSLIPPDALVIGSLDFSHYLTSDAADFHDIQALSVINNFDYDRIGKLDIDSHSGLRLLLKYLDARGAKKITLTNHSNSARITGNFELTETTSYINGSFSKGQNIPDQIETTLYIQNWPEELAESAFWNSFSTDYAFRTIERLFKYNDETVSAYGHLPEGATRLGFNTKSTTNLNSALDFLNIDAQLIAVGLVQDAGKVTDIYLFPLEYVQYELKLLSHTKADMMLREIAQSATGSPELKQQILTGHIIIK